MKNAAVEAIRFALKTECEMTFLQLWFEGEFDRIRKDWPEAPEDIFPVEQKDPEPIGFIWRKKGSTEPYDWKFHADVKQAHDRDILSCTEIKLVYVTSPKQALRIAAERALCFIGGFPLKEGVEMGAKKVYEDLYNALEEK